MKKVADIHGHYVFGVDDGAASKAMSLAMIESAYEQGARHIFCTSHDSADVHAYKRNLQSLKESLQEQGMDLQLHSGCEIYCEEPYMDDIIEALSKGYMLPMGTSKYILMEFSPWTDSEEIITCVSRIRKETGFEPIIAHFERCLFLQDEPGIFQTIKERKLPIQINAYSLVQESREKTRNFARKLLQEGVVTFVGSDAHRTDHRPVSLTSGVNYIYENCDEEYAKDVCYRNAEALLMNR